MQIVFKNAPDGTKPILPPDFFTLSVSTAGTTHADLINATAKTGDLGCYFRFDSKAVFLNPKLPNDFTTEHLVTTFHIGQVEICQEIAEQGKNLISERVPKQKVRMLLIGQNLSHEHGSFELHCLCLFFLQLRMPAQTLIDIGQQPAGIRVKGGQLNLLATSGQS